MRAIFALFVATTVAITTMLAGGDEPDSVDSFVLLKNLAVLPGTIREEPGHIRIVQKDGELRVPRDRIACWSPTLRGLHQYLIDHRSGSNVESHIEIARWCLLNHYPAGATAETIAALRLDPDHPEARRLEQDLRSYQTKQVSPEVTAPPGEQVLATDPTEVAGQAADELFVKELQEFTRSIQPILLNQCSQAACHGTDSGQAFQLNKPHKSLSRPDAEMSRQNLKSVVRWLDRESPMASPLLVRSLEPHGSLSQPPLGPQQRVAVTELRTWVLGFSKATRNYLGDSVASAVPSQQIGSANEAISSLGGSGNSARSSAPIRLPVIDDPFDPEVFNRRFHPHREN
jgi:hypothetical protein